MDPRADGSACVPVPPLPAAQAATLLAPPFLPVLAAERLRLAERAAQSRVPVLLLAPGALHLRLARALHAVSRRNGPLFATAGPHPPVAGIPADATLLVDVGTLGDEAVPAIAALVDDGAVWMLAALRPDDALPPMLAGRLGAVTVEVPPLAARPGDIGPLAEAILRQLADRAGRTAPPIAPEAVARLVEGAWPGDVVELESVLARAYLLAGDAGIRADDLVVTPAAGGAPSPPAPPPVAEGPTGFAGDSGADERLAFLLAEMAHELRNPMVTIKTFANHLPDLLEDAQLRTHFAALADEAIARMNGLLENVVTFGRLGAPQRQTVDLGALLARVADDLATDAGERVLRVEQTGATGGRCRADPEHLDYALRNVLAGVLREAPRDERVVIDARVNGVVALRFAPGSTVAERLRAVLGGGGAPVLSDPTLLPLAFTLARAVLARNGGTITVVPEVDDATTVVVRLPAAEHDGA